MNFWNLGLRLFPNLFLIYSWNARASVVSPRCAMEKRFFVECVASLWKSVTRVFADFSPNLNASPPLVQSLVRFLSLSLSNRRVLFSLFSRLSLKTILFLRFFSFFVCPSVSSSLFHYVRANPRQERGGGGEETGGKLSIFRLEERDRRCSVNIEKTKSLVLYRKFYWNPKIVGIKLGAYASGVFIFRIKIHVWAGSVQFCLIRGGIIIPRGVLIV